MKGCEEYELLISAFLDGELSGDERAELAEHLTACPRCQRYFDDLVAIHDAFDQEEVPVPEDFAENVMARVRETPQEGTNKVIRFPHWRRWTALAACCAFAALGLWSARLWLTSPRVVSQTAMADSAMPSSGVPEISGDGGDGLMVMMDEEPVYVEPETPAEMENAADSDLTAGKIADAANRESATEKVASNYEEDTCLVAAPAPTADGLPEILCGSITAGGPAARAWVETELGLEWEIGRVYPLTEEEYAGLLEALTDAGEAFQQELGEQFQLLAAESAP